MSNRELTDPVVRSESTLMLEAEIAELKKQNRQFLDIESRFKTIADTAPVLVWMSETDMLCSYFNKGWLEFTGRTMEQECGNGWAEGVHPEDFDRCLDIYVTSFEQRLSFTMEYRLKRHDGQFRWILDNGVPRYAPDGEFLGYIGSCIDIHEQKSLNYELENNNAKLAVKNAELKAFNYVATHDLQEPLRKITNYSDLVNQEFAEVISPTVSAYLRKIKDEAANMQGLITSLLEYTLLSDDKNWEETINLGQLLNEAIEAFGSEIEDKNVKITIGQLPTLRVVPSHIRIVFSNLLSNSLKFARIGVEPQVSITANKVKSGAKINKRLKDERYWEISFTDNGTGFENKYSDLVFELFQKVGPLRNDGAGVGLAIAKKILINHHGEIIASSALNEGTTITMYFPEKYSGNL